MTIYKMVDGVLVALTPEEMKELEQLANNPPPPLQTPPGPGIELPNIPGLD
jgi:hypothetical protein